MTLKTLTLSLIIIALTAVVIASNYNLPPGRPYQCMFNNMNGVYFTSERELHSNASLIEVRGADGRVHAFIRANLEGCREVTE